MKVRKLQKVITSPSLNKVIVSYCTVESCHNGDPVITKNIWKPGRITVKYVETNPAIAIDSTRCNEYFVRSLAAVSKNDRFE